jgi:hypothetical protein
MVNVLFVAESPPVGGTFFYNANSNLFWYTWQAFERVFGDRCGREEAFLRFFRDTGCYLDDLCLTPVNDLPDPQRRRHRRDGVAPLAMRMRAIRPKTVVVMMKEIRRQAEQAAASAGLSGVPFYVLPFPSMGWQLKFMDALTALLPALPLGTKK